MASNEMMIPGYGGLVRYKEEYNSKFKISPSTVIAMIIIVIAFVVGLGLIWPVKSAAALLPLLF
jgi:preprotein translocase subunit Sec61beta